MNYKEYLENKKKEYTPNISVKQASKLMGKSEQFVRIAMQRNIINIGTCVKKEGNKRYDYYISPYLLEKYIGEKKKNDIYII